VFESEYGGFCTTFSRSTDRFNLDALIAGFGSEWQTLGVRLKLYACNGSTHSTLDAIRELQAERPFGAGDVAKIVVHGSKGTVEHVGWKYEPQGLTAAQLNLGYCVATLLVEGECFVDQFTDRKLADPARMALAHKVEARHDPEITARGPKFRQMVRVEVHLKGGARLERTVEIALRKKEIASEGEIVKKFEDLATHALPRRQVEELRDAVLGLERLDDASRIAQLMVKT